MTQTKTAFICIIIVNSGPGVRRDGHLFIILCGVKYYEGNTNACCFAPAKVSILKKDFFFPSVLLPAKMFIGKMTIYVTIKSESGSNS